jgi:hypothetical protein
MQRCKLARILRIGTLPVSIGFGVDIVGLFDLSVAAVSSHIVGVDEARRIYLNEPQSSSMLTG